MRGKVAKYVLENSNRGEPEAWPLQKKGKDHINLCYRFDFVILKALQIHTKHLSLDGKKAHLAVWGRNEQQQL